MALSAMPVAKMVTLLPTVLNASQYVMDLALMATMLEEEASEEATAAEEAALVEEGADLEDGTHSTIFLAQDQA